MKNIKVLGTSSVDFRETYSLIEAVAHDQNINVVLEKVQTRSDIIRYGVMCLPGVVIDGEVVHFGHVPSKAMVLKWLSV